LILLDVDDKYHHHPPMSQSNSASDEISSNFVDSKIPSVRESSNVSSIRSVEYRYEKGWSSRLIMQFTIQLPKGEVQKTCASMNTKYEFRFKAALFT
jgi:hypothetical protein